MRGGRILDLIPIRESGSGIFSHQRKFYGPGGTFNVSRKEVDNILRWDGERGFYEVYFLKFNDAKSKTAYWIRYTVTSPKPHVGDPYCELWGMFFDIENPQHNFAVKSRYPIADFAYDKDRFRVGVGGAEITMNSCFGEIIDKSNGHRMSWNLEVDSPAPGLRHLASDFYYTSPYPTTKSLAPHWNATFNGTVDIDGRILHIAKAPGSQEHIWGLKHALRWAWGHCNAFAEEPDAVWEAADGQVALGPLPSPYVTMCYLQTRGRIHSFNTFPNIIKARAGWKLGEWNFKFDNGEIALMGEIKVAPRDIIAVTYMDPDGEFLWCNNAKVASIKLAIKNKKDSSTWELTSANGCAVEFVDRKIYPEVPVRL